MRKPRLDVLVKPASYECNMACDYCYYRGVQSLYPGAERPRMRLEVFDALCEQYRALEPSEIRIAWQGGEPTLMGLDFFGSAVEVETSHARAGDCWGNSLQTNGVVLDDDWCAFLARNRFLIGLSVDGPAELNRVRRFPNGRPAFDTAMRAAGLLQKYGCEFNVLVVVSAANVEHPERIFRFLVEGGFHFSQVIPCTEPAGGKAVTEHSISADQYGRFMIRLFDAWVDHDDPAFYVRDIDNWLHLYCGFTSECCEYRRDCSNLLTIEWNGDVYPCDFWVRARYRLGNVLDQTLEQMLRTRTWRQFVAAAEHCPAFCRDCEWLWACNAGCYRHRAKLGIGADQKPYLCDAKKQIFSHVFGRLDQLKARPVRPRLHKFLNDIDRKVSAGPAGPDASAGPADSEDTRATRRAPGRNDPCPCGSGRKYKSCCMRRVGSPR